MIFLSLLLKITTLAQENEVAFEKNFINVSDYFDNSSKLAKKIAILWKKMGMDHFFLLERKRNIFLDFFTYDTATAPAKCNIFHKPQK